VSPYGWSVTTARSPAATDAVRIKTSSLQSMRFAATSEERRAVRWEV
jgi:hypothetical protein